MTWWTGDALLVFDAGNLTQRYTIAAGRDDCAGGARGDDGGQLLVPVTGPGSVSMTRSAVPTTVISQ